MNGVNIVLNNTNDELTIMSKNNNYQLTILNNYIYVSSNAGSSWLQIDLVTLSINANSTISSRNLAISESGQYMIIGIPTMGLLISINYGINWKYLEINKNWQSISMSSSGQYIVATTNNDGIYYSSNYSRDFTLANNTLSINWLDSYMDTTGANVVAITNNTTNINYSLIYYSTNNGMTWTASATSCDGILSNITGTDSYILITTSTNLYYSTNNGVSWTTLLLSNMSFVTYLFYIDADNNLLFSKDNGTNWIAYDNTISNNSAITLSGNYISAVRTAHALNTTSLTTTSYRQAQTGGDPHICTINNVKYILDNKYKYVNLLFDKMRKVIINSELSKLTKDDFPNELNIGNIIVNKSKIPSCDPIFNYTYYRTFFIQYNMETITIDADTLEYTTNMELQFMKVNKICDSNKKLYSIQSELSFEQSDDFKQLEISLGNYKFIITIDKNTTERHYCELQINSNIIINNLYGALISKDKILVPSHLSDCLKHTKL